MTLGQARWSVQRREPEPSRFLLIGSETVA